MLIIGPTAKNSQSLYSVNCQLLYFVHHKPTLCRIAVTVA